MRPGLIPGRSRARSRFHAAHGSGRRGARRGRGRGGGRHRGGRGRRRRTGVPSSWHRRRRRLRRGRLIVRHGADERAGRGRGSGRRNLCHRRCRRGRRASGRGRLRRLRAGARRAVRTVRERGHAGEPESERKNTGAYERSAPGTRPAAGLVPGDLAATLPVGNRRSLIVRLERITDGCGCGGNGHDSSVPQLLRPLNAALLSGRRRSRAVAWSSWSGP